MNWIYYEDVVVGEKITEGQYSIDKTELLEFARKWDRRPFHIDEEAANSYPYGGLIAPAPYLLSVAARMLTPLDKPRLAVIGLLEYEHVRILRPGRPGDLLTVTSETIEKRESKSNPRQGIVRHEIVLRNHRDEVVASYLAAFIIEKRPL
ncbi:MAG: MaoC family dehydratase N-terminal domain-containing protein [Desulfobacterales bacterium]|jgi:acyl dehydratase|nr:MaoC family dehydratase N-terminal domain-containing protein [Desulfobacterales bacterium]